MRSWAITESTVTFLNGFDIAWLPDQAYSYVTPQLKHTKGNHVLVGLESGPFVGAIPLSNGDILRIGPQAGEKALWRMLLLSEGLAGQLEKEFESFIEISYTDAGIGSWMALLARAYFEQLRLIEKSSLRSERVLVKRRLVSARGRVQLIPTIISLEKHESLPVHARYRERTFQTLEHRVLGTAARRLHDIGFVEPGSKAIALRWASHAAGRLKQTELRDVVAALRNRQYTGSRSYYIPALLMARLLLVEAGISFDDEHTVSSEVLLTNIRTLFEKYVRGILQKALYDKGFVVDKQQEHPRSLFEDGTCKLIPDVLVSDVGGVRLILDAKYKIDKEVTEGDYYQMTTYLNRFGISTGVLVFPSLSTTNGTLKTRRTVSGLMVHEIRLPIDNWKATEQFLTVEVQRLLGS